MNGAGEKSNSLYKNKVKRNLTYLNKILSLASSGDFSRNLRIPQKEDEFTELFVGIQLLIDVIREKISELKKERNSIETEKDKLATLIEDLPVGVSIIDAQSGRAIMMNKMGTKIFGVNISKTKNESFVEQFKVYKENGEECPVSEHPVFITFKNKKRALKSNLIAKHPDGKMIAVKSQSVPVFDKNGKMVSIIAVFDDITRQKELDKIKTQFLSVASHQLRTPLGTMRWNLEMLLNEDYGKVKKEIRTVIEDLYDSNNKLITLVNDLLNVSRIEDGRDFDRPLTVNIEEVIRKTIKIVKPLALARDVKITFHKLSEVNHITIDKTKFENIILNLLTNGVKYNFSGGTVSVFTLTRKKRLIIKVKDTGVGISEKDQERIFSKFYRTEDAIKLASEGTGLGLFVVKRYVELWGGKISLKSSPGKGSEFVISIPLFPKLNLQSNTS